MGHFLQKGIEKSSGENSRQLQAGSASFLYDVQGNRKYLTKSERRAFLRSSRQLPDEARTFCKMLAYTGCRISEALSLSPRRIDISARLVIIESLKKRRKGIYRAVPIPRSFLADLETAHSIRTKQNDPCLASEPLWSFGRTTAWKHVKTAMRVSMIEGVRASPKGLRHGFGVGTLEAGVPLNLIRRWLGHSRISTTAIYADAMGDEEQILAARFWRTF